jgi:hypothetical protein
LPLLFVNFNDFFRKGTKKQQKDKPTAFTFRPFSRLLFIFHKGVKKQMPFFIFHKGEKTTKGKGHGYTVLFFLQLAMQFYS